MSRYPVWWDSTITIYNRYEDPLTHVISWHKHVLTDCFWKNVSEKLTVGTTVLETNSIICRIPESELYLEKYVWDMLDDSRKDDYFTLGYKDIIIKGSVDDVINEYASGHRSTDVLAKYKKLGGCLEIDTFSNNTGAGRGLPHYHVRGI